MDELIQRLGCLNESEKKIFDRIFSYQIDNISQVVPPEIFARYGSKVENQELLRVRNKVIFQESLFNVWRGRRPEPIKDFKPPVDDIFSQPEKTTPIDEVGRIESNFSLTASNLTKIARHHSLVIFKNNNPFNLSQIEIQDSFQTAFEWFKKIKVQDEKVQTPIVFWNFLYRAGASVFHPHLQILYLDQLPAKLEFLSDRAGEYEKKFGSNYWQDLFLVSKSLGLAKEIGNGFRILVSLTPAKERELIILVDQWSGCLDRLAGLIEKYINLGSQSFNLFLVGGDEKSKPIGFIVDRGPLSEVNADIGSLELYAFTVVSFDPFAFAQTLRENSN